MRLLLDTHLLIWMVSTPSKISKKTRTLIERSPASASVASIWEVSIKSELGKIKLDPSALLDAIENAGLDLLPISGDHATAVATLPKVHRDPFDRMLVCQAVSEGLTLLTSDVLLLQYGPMVRLA